MNQLRKPAERAFRQKRKDGWTVEPGDLFAFTQAGILRRKFQHCLIVFSCGPDGVMWSTKVRGAVGLQAKRGVSWVWKNLMKERTREKETGRENDRNKQCCVGGKYLDLYLLKTWFRLANHRDEESNISVWSTLKCTFDCCSWCFLLFRFFLFNFRIHNWHHLIRILPKPPKWSISVSRDSVLVTHVRTLTHWKLAEHMKTKVSTTEKNINHKNSGSNFSHRATWVQDGGLWQLTVLRSLKSDTYALFNVTTVTDDQDTRQTADMEMYSSYRWWKVVILSSRLQEEMEWGGAVLLLASAGLRIFWRILFLYYTKMCFSFPSSRPLLLVWTDVGRGK